MTTPTDTTVTIAPTCLRCGHSYAQHVDRDCSTCTKCSAERFAEQTTAEPARFCGACGEREGSVYAKHCCTDDQMIED